MKYLLIFIFGYIAGYSIGFKAGRTDLENYLAMETLKRVYPTECRQCPIFQENLKKSDLSETTISIL